MVRRILLRKRVCNTIAGCIIGLGTMTMAVMEDGDGISRTIGESLILEVEKNPILYDRSRPDYGRSDLKEAIWLDIARRIGISDSEVQSKWRNIKDAMTKYHRKSKTLQRDQSSLKPYKYSHLLGFLVPSLGERSTNNNDLDSSTTWEAEDIVIDFDQANVLQAGDSDNEDSIKQENTRPPSPSPSSDPTPANTEMVTSAMTIPRKKRRAPASNAADLAMVEFLRAAKEPAPQHQLDETDMFMNAMGSIIRKLPAKSRAQVRFAIHKILHEAEMEYL